MKTNRNFSKWIFLLTICLLAMPLTSVAALETRTSRPDLPASAETPGAAIDQAIAQVLAANPAASGLIAQNTRSDAAHAVAFMANSDPAKYPYVLLIVATLDPASGQWSAYAPSIGDDAGYNAALSTVPDAILDAASRAYYAAAASTTAGDQPSALSSPSTQPMFSALAEAVPMSVTGHKLPWQGGTTAIVTQIDAPYHMHQVDFVIGNEKVYASKPGTVIYVKESAPDPASPECVNDGVTWKKMNYVVVKHSDTDYSWYGHFKYNSVAVSVGQNIGFGTLLGTQGRTGYTCGTTGIHLHYMAATAMPPLNWFPDPSLPDEATWPYPDTIAIVNFAEIPWASITNLTTYTSQNYPNTTSVSSLPVGAVECADDGGVCNFNGIGTVYYGDSGAYYALANITMSTPCAVGSFGDPDPGQPKKCYVVITASAPVCPTLTSGVKLFSGTACTGLKKLLSSGLTQLELGTFNDITQSIVVASGWSARVYQNNSAIEADSACITATDSNLNDNTFANSDPLGSSITWVNVYQNSTCTPNMKPAAFGKVGPADGATNVPVSMVISWQDSTAATSYEYCYDTTDDDACTGWVSKGVIISNKSLVLLPTTTYYWQVRAVNGNGTEYADASSTAYWSFTTAAMPGFSKTAPIDGATNTSNSVAVSWAAMPGASAYEYCWDNTDDDACSNWINAGTSRGKTITGLGGYTTYYWQVRATVGGSKILANDGTWWAFTVGAYKPAKPTSVHASDGTYTNKITVTWDAPDGADASAYKIYRATGTTLPSIALAENISGTSYDDTSVVPGKKYYYWVRACNVNGCNVSAYNSGYTPPLPTIDLTVKSILLSNSGVSTSVPANLVIKVKNLGNSASGSFTLTIYDGSAPGGCSASGAVDVSVPSIAAASSINVSAAVPFASSGSHNLYAFADSACGVSETAEGNNVFGPFALSVAP